MIDTYQTEVRTFSDLRGLARHRPFLAVSLTSCLFSFIGIPPLGGFFGKLYINIISYR